MEPGQWLAQVQEEPIDAERRICDPHHHLWDYPKSRYLLDELLADTGDGHNVVSTVFVECRSMYRAAGDPAMATVGETEFVNGIAAMSASGRYGSTRVAAGIVGYADLTLSNVGEVLDRHLAAAPERFRGVRHAAAWDASDAVRNSHTKPPPHLYDDAQFRSGFKALSERGLSFDAWLYHPQIPELTGLARAFGGTSIILDHFGGPLGIGPYADKRDEIFPTWQKDLADLAQCENVVAKLGGIVMPVNGFGFHQREKPATSDEVVALTGRYHRHAIECFGPERCMFESNFPVDKASCSYGVLWNAFKKIAADFSASEKAALFHDTAARVYRIN